MNRNEIFNSFLLSQFHEFYSEVINQKKVIEARSKTLEPVGESRKPVEEGGHPVFMKLLAILEKQVLEARAYGGEYGVAFYKEAQYVMAALADEIFLNTEWDGKEEWMANLLEFKLFGTYNAGDFFFQKLDKILKDRDPAYTEMAAVYFLSLSMGFKGKFRNMDDGGQLEFYRRQLFAFIFKKNSDIMEETRKLFPQPYEHTLTQGTGEKLPYNRIWIGLMIVLGVVFLGASHGIWMHLTDDLVGIVNKIILEFGTL